MAGNPNTARTKFRDSFSLHLVEGLEDEDDLGDDQVGQEQLVGLSEDAVARRACSGGSPVRCRMRRFVSRKGLNRASSPVPSVFADAPQTTACRA